MHRCKVWYDSCLDVGIIRMNYLVSVAAEFSMQRGNALCVVFLLTLLLPGVLAVHCI